MKKLGHQKEIGQAGIRVVKTNVYQTNTRFHEYPADYQPYSGKQLGHFSHFTYTRHVLLFTECSGRDMDAKPSFYDIHGCTAQN